MRRLRFPALTILAGSALLACAKGNVDLGGGGGGYGEASVGGFATEDASASTQEAVATSATSGQGGDTPHTSVGVTTAVGAGGFGGDPSVTIATVSGANTTSTSSGSGGASPACDHDVCSDGGPLKTSCNACSAAVCAADPFCCTTAWDEICIGQTGDHCAGDPCGVAGTSAASSSASGGGGSTLMPGDLLVTEVMNDPAKVDDSKGEWFEVRNMTAAPIDLKGLVIRHQLVAVDPNAVETIAKSVIVPANGYVVLGNNTDAATNGGVKVDYAYTSKVTMNNTKDYVGLETSDVPAVSIDGTTYDTAKLKVTGKSRSLDPGSMTTLGNDTDVNFCAAKSLIAGSTDYGTPGKANDSCK